MDFWNKVPFLRVVIPLILGIVFEIENWIGLELPMILFILGVLYIASATFFFKRKSWSKNGAYAGILIIITSFTGGFVLSWSNRSNNYDTHFQSQDINKEIVLKGIVIDPPQEKSRSVKAFIQVTSYKSDQIHQAVSGNILLYLEKSATSLNLNYGDKIVFKCIPNEVRPPANPEQFNFQKYLANNDIYHQTYVKTGGWKKVEKNCGSPIRARAFSVRNKLLGILEKHIPDAQNRAIASALVLGYKDYLDPDILRSFSSAGAMHVLAVSGLHVGIIFILLGFLLKPVSNMGHYGPWIRAFILLFGLWGYAFVTGLSPSVQRAATMFSFIIIGSATGRPTNVYNTLSASAFLLILIDPLIVTKVGFQLSYLAVLGIVYLQPKIYSWLNFNNWLMDKVWAITCVSCAAQIATFPLGLYYFHQFPNYFFVSNLVVIPMATLILYGGIILILFHFIGYTDVIAWLLNKFLIVLNKSVILVENIPYSLMYGNYIGIVETLLLYSAVLSGFIWLALKEKTWFWVFSTHVLILLVLSAVGRYDNANQKQLIVYQVPGKSVLNFISGKTNILVSDADFLSDDSQQLYHVKHNWFFSGFTEGDLVEMSDNYKGTEFAQMEGLIKFHGLRLFHVHDMAILNKIDRKVKANILVLSGDYFFNLDEIESKVSFEQLVIDSSVPRKTASIVESLARRRGWSVFNVNRNSAFTYEI